MAGAEKEMTFWDHLDALRMVLIRLLLVVLTASIVLFCFKDFIFDGLILAPTRPDFFLYRLLGENV